MIDAICRFVWGPPLILFIFGSGLFLTIRLRGIQFRYFAMAISMVFRSHGSGAKGAIAPYQALLTALCGTIGIGNIAGVATAVVTGGPGALFWMVIAALVGMATSYTENFLSVRYRTGEGSGGPMYYISQGLGLKWLAVVFAVGGLFAALTTGNMVQMNAVSDVLGGILAVDRWIIGAVLAATLGLILIGGIRGIARISTVVVPLMAGFYLIGALAILAMKASLIPSAIVQIIHAAFTPQAGVGGVLGATVFMAMRMGVSRGILASEAGLGTSCIAAAAARTDSAGRQALISMTGSFISVCIVCMITGLVLSVTGLVGTLGVDGHPLSGILLTSASFDSVLPYGRYIVAIGALLFGYTTVISWSYYGEKCAEYLFGARTVPLFRLAAVATVFLGSMLNFGIVWNLADIGNACMVVPNLVALLALSKLVVNETAPYLKVLKAEGAL